jgi:outer membrane protein assembly factor BamA
VRRLATLALLIAAPRVAIAAEPDAPPAGSVPDYVVERVELRGNGRTADEVLLRHVPYRRGDHLVPTDAALQLVRYRLLSTGFFSRADLRLERGTARGQVVLVVEVVERNTLIVENLWVGVAADEGDDGGAEPVSPFLGLRIAERNLVGTGVTLGGGIGLADEQVSLRADFADPTFLGSEWAATASLLFVDGRDFFGARDVVFESPYSVDRRLEHYAVVPFERIGGQIGTGRDLSLTTSFALGVRLEHVEATPPLVASHDHGGRREPIAFDVLPGESVLSGIEASLLYDTRDAPFLVTRGSLVQGRLTLGLPPLGSDYGFARVEAVAQRWFPLPFGHVLRLQGFVGAIAGDAPFFEQYYVGDFTDLLPDRVLELAPDRRKAPNLFGTAIGLERFGELAAKLDLEYRIPLYRGRESILGVDAFASAGLYALTTRRALEDPAPELDGLAAVPIDLTYNVGLRVDTSVGGATLAFSNLLGLLPARGSDP